MDINDFGLETGIPVPHTGKTSKWREIAMAIQPGMSKFFQNESEARAATVGIRSVFKKERIKLTAFYKPSAKDGLEGFRVFFIPLKERNVTKKK